MGNNRMVVNDNGDIEQVTHYYPYGGVIGDISTNENLQKYKFEGKELDRTFGLDNYDIHTRQYFAMMPSWDRIDKKAEDYYPTSPYAYCGGDPVNRVDMKGDSVCILLAPSGACEYGHMAISPEAFLDDLDVNMDKDGNAIYTKGFTISCDKTDDAMAKDAALKEIDEYYSIIGNNCAVTVQKALDAIKSKDVDNGATNSKGEKTIVPNTIYKNIKDNNDGMETIILNCIEIKF